LHSSSIIKLDSLSSTASLMRTFVQEENPVELPEKEHADLRTMLSLLCDAVGSLLGTGYWIGQGIDSFTEEPEIFFAKLSEPALLVGFTIAFLTTLSSTYIHSILYTNHQKQPEQPATISSEDFHLYTTARGNLKPKDGMIDLDIVNNSLYVLDIIFNKYQLFPPAQKKEPTKLTWPQTILVAGDVISHIADGASIPAVFYNAAKQNPSLPVNLCMQMGGTLFGMVNSSGLLRVCVKPLLHMNEKKQDNNQNNDIHEDYVSIPIPKSPSSAI